MAAYDHVDLERRKCSSSTFAIIEGVPFQWALHIDDEMNLDRTLQDQRPMLERSRRERKFKSSSTSRVLMLYVMSASLRHRRNVFPYAEAS